MHGLINDCKVWYQLFPFYLFTVKMLYKLTTKKEVTGSEKTGKIFYCYLLTVKWKQYVPVYFICFFSNYCPADKVV